MEIYKLKEIETKIKLAETKLQLALIHEEEKNVLESIRKNLNLLREMKERLSKKF